MKWNQLKWLKLTLLTEVLAFWAATSFLSRPNGANEFYWILTCYGGILIWLVLLVLAFLPQNWPHSGTYAVVLALGLIQWVMQQPLADQIRPILFNRDLPKMEKLVASIENGSLHGGDTRDKEITDFRTPDFEISVFGHLKKPSSIRFVVGGGLTGIFSYVFSPDGKVKPEMQGSWLKVKRLNQRWFEVTG